MGYRVLGVWLLLLLVAIPVVAAAAAPVEAYGRLPSIERIALSPDGSRIAIVTTVSEVRLLTIINLKDGIPITKVRVGDARLRGMLWADDRHLLMETASSVMPYGLEGERVEWNLLNVFDVQTQKAVTLLDHVRGDIRTMNTVYGPLVVQRQGEETLLYVHGFYISGKTQPGLFRINLTSGTEVLIRKGDNTTGEWVVDDNGEIIAAKGYTEKARRWTIDLFHEGRPGRTVSGIAPIDVPEILGVSPKGDSLVVALTAADGTTWKQLSISDATWGADLAPNEAVTGVVMRNGSRHLIGTAFIGDSVRYHFSDPQLQEDWDWINRVFHYQQVEFVSAAADYSRILVQVMGGKFGFAYYLADVKEHLTSKIGDVYEGLEQIAEVRPIRYRAADGLEIPAYLTLPPGRPEKNLPVIVMPHGGPAARDMRRFDWWAQALAAQGYAVLQPNFRGSDLSQKWMAAGYGEWGRKMQTDLSDGLQHLATQGIVDPQRACIVGASYGGYAALAGVALQSGIYRCSIAVAGISDLSAFMRWIGRKEQYGAQTGLRWEGRFLDVADPGDPRLEAISPLRHADRITVPLLLIHGRDDVTVPYDQSAQLARVMQRAGMPVQFVTLAKEDHYLSRSETRLQMLQASIDFLRKNNPPD
jgi:dipeptidyl aminopeptidase/acylaminoacyl peptidase